MRYFIISCIVLSLSLSACSGGARVSDSPSKKQTTNPSAPSAGENDSKPSDGIPPKTQTGCMQATNVKTKLETMEDLVAFINALPKPVSLACLMEALPRPLYLHLISKSVSGQTTSGTTAPRIFIFLSPSLVITVVPAGLGARKIEIGLRTSPIDSIKGEIAFPVTETLPLDITYKMVVSYGNIGTHCANCHANEQNVSKVNPIAFSSSIMFPEPFLYMSLKDLEAMTANCEKEKKEECPVLQAIFSQGQVIEREFQ